MSPSSVRVVQAGWPSAIYVAIDRAPEDVAVERELLADDVPSMDAGMKLAEARLRERGQRVGQWRPVGPCVREAFVFGASTC